MRTATTMLIFLVLANPVAAWHQSGHYAVARIAWKQLSDKEQAQFSTLLKSHPHYDVYLTAECPKELSKIEWAFLRAATWSDWVRSPTGPDLMVREKAAIKDRYNKSVWHYVDLPYIHPNDTGKFDVAAIRKTILEPENDDKGEPRHALAALKLAMKELQAAETSDADKAVSLCWLLHVAGDLHQPCHTTSLIASKDTYTPSLDPPGGDQGGNLVLIRIASTDKKATKLHFYWDALLFTNYGPYSEVDAMVASSLNELKRDQFPELKSTEFIDWAEEGLEIAKRVVYKADGGMLKVLTVPAGKTAKVVGVDAPILPDSYQKAAAETARRRMVLAGYRIADQLHLIAKNTK